MAKKTIKWRSDWTKTTHQNGIVSYAPNDAARKTVAQDMKKSGLIDQMKKAGLDMSSWEAFLSK